MRVLAIHRSTETNQPPSPELIRNMTALIDEMTRDGTLIATEGCMPTAVGKRVWLDNGRLCVVDGPFAESKEVIGGFALLECTSMAHAVELTERFLRIAGPGESELRIIADAAHQPH